MTQQDNVSNLQPALPVVMNQLTAFSSNSTEDRNNSAEGTTVGPGICFVQRSPAGDPSTYTNGIGKNADKPLSMAIGDVHSTKRDVSAFGSQREGTAEEYFLQQIASFAALTELSRNERETLEDIKIITAGPAKSLSSPRMSGAVKQRENLRELDSLVNMANVLQQMAVCYTDLGLPQGREQHLPRKSADLLHNVSANVFFVGGAENDPFYLFL